MYKQPIINKATKNLMQEENTIESGSISTSKQTNKQHQQEK